MTRVLAIALIVLLAGCGEERPPAPTGEESEQLNEVEALLNREAGTQEGPAPPGTGPPNGSTKGPAKAARTFARPD